MLRPVQDRYLPPDREAFLASEPPTGRVIVIAPTRAACETIELALGLNLDTFLEKHHGAQVRALAAAGKRLARRERSNMSDGNPVGQDRSHFSSSWKTPV